METRAFCDPIFKDIPCVVTVGIFDGLHPGHMKIMKETVRTAKKLGAKSVAVTFSVNPKPGAGAPLLSPAGFKEILTKLGIDFHCVIDFSPDMSKLSGEEFIALLCTSYRLRAMVVGESFRAGVPSRCVAPSDIGRLLAVHTSSAFLMVVQPVVIDGQVVSSSLIRRCLLTGDLAQASRLLGRAYSLDLRDKAFSDEGTDDTSRKRLFCVRTLGLFLPKAGRYVVEATEDGRCERTTAVVSEDRLTLDLPVRMNPDGITFLGE